MPRVKLIEPGYENFSDFLGTIRFENGVSVDNISTMDARFLASLIQVADADTGVDPGDNAKFVASLEMSAPMETLLTNANTGTQQVQQAPAQQIPARQIFSREQLEAVADKYGINGLRDIADPLDVKSTSIANLIDGILAKQQGFQPNAAMLAEGQPDAPVEGAIDAPAEGAADVPAEGVDEGEQGANDDAQE